MTIVKEILGGLSLELQNRLNTRCELIEVQGGYGLMLKVYSFAEFFSDMYVVVDGNKFKVVIFTPNPPSHILARTVLFECSFSEPDSTIDGLVNFLRDTLTFDDDFTELA